MDYLAHYDTDGKYRGFYPTDIKYKEIPKPTIKLTKEQHQEAMTGNYKVIDGVHTYSPYVATAAEILEKAKDNKLIAIKTKIAETDYKAIKFAEGAMTAEEFEPVKKERQSFRAAYNAIKACTTKEELETITLE